jgi:hypothetical protein
MKENYTLLYGEDVIKIINVDTRNLRFQCEQELKAKLIHLRQAYIRLNADKTSLRHLLLKSFTSVLHILRNVLRLKGRVPPYLKQDIINDVASEFRINKLAWEKILAIRDKGGRLDRETQEGLFIDFIRDLEKIVEAVDKF